MQALRYLGLGLCRAGGFVAAVIGFPFACLSFVAYGLFEYSYRGEESLRLSIRGNRIENARRRLDRALKGSSQ